VASGLALDPTPKECRQQLDLSRIHVAPITGAGCLAFVCQRAFASQRRVPAAWVIEAVDILEDDGFGLATGLPRPAPDEFGFDGLEERLDNGVVMAIRQ